MGWDNACWRIQKGGKQMKKYALMLMKYASKIAVLTVILSANTACNWFAYQQEVPEGLNKFKRL